MGIVEQGVEAAGFELSTAMERSLETVELRD